VRDGPLITGMSACHTKAFVAAGVVIAPPQCASISARKDEAPVLAEESCDYCGSNALEWRKCKLICTNCRQINKSCADL